MLLLAALVLTTSQHTLLPVHAGNGFYDTPAQTGQLIDVNGKVIANYGTSSEYPFNAPDTKTTIQFYAGLESHTDTSASADASTGIANLHITVTGTDPSGAAIQGRYLNGLDIRGGPDSNISNQQQLMAFIFNALLNTIPYGIGTDIQNVINSQPGLTANNPGNTAFGDWSCGIACGPNPPYFGPKDKSIMFGFQLQIGNALQGTYTINLSYHVQWIYCTGFDQFGCTGYYVTSADLSDNLYYCYLSCNRDFSIVASPTSVSVNSANSVTSAYSTITLTSQNSFAGAVDLTASASDPSLQLSLVPQSVTVPLAGSASSLLSINAPWTSCKTGTFTVTVTSANGIGHSVTISVTTLSCPPPDFSFWASPTTAIFNSQAVASSAIYAQSVNGMTGTVSLGFTTSPSTGSNCALGNTGITLSSPSDWHSVGLLCGESTLGTYTVTVTGTWGTISHTLTVSFINQSSGGGCTSSNTCPKHT